MDYEGLLPDKEALDFMADVLAKESLRFINKCLEEAQESLELYKGLGNVEKKAKFRFADVLALTFLKTKYPVIFAFLSNYIDLVEQKLANFSESIERENFIKSLKKDDFKLIKYIEHITGQGLKLRNAEDVEKIFAQSFRFWHEEIYRPGSRGKIDLESPEARDDVLSNPSVLKSFLSMVVNKDTNPVTDAIEIYKEHINNKDRLVNISIPELINYSRVLRDIRNAPPTLSLDVAKAIFDRIFNDESTLQPMGRRDESIRGEAVYQFSFQILEVFEKRTNKQSLNQYEIEAKDLLKEFLLSSAIDTGSKFLVINSFANTDRVGHSDINWRLNNAFDVMYKFDKNLVPVLQAVFKEFDSRYISGDKIIYDSEENFRFVLFQAWSGFADNIKEIEGIRKCALRGLDQNINAIKSYWDQYDFPGEKGWNPDVIEQIVEGGGINADKFDGANIYLPLDALIRISQKVDLEDSLLNKKIEFWSALRQNSKTKQWFVPRNDLRTLKAVLIQREFLPDEDIVVFKDITKDSLEKYTKFQYPNMDISFDYQDKILSILVNSQKYRRITDIDQVVQKMRPLISQMYNANPHLFKFGTDFISKSLGLYDKQFMGLYQFGPPTIAIFEKLRIENPDFFK